MEGSERASEGCATAHRVCVCVCVKVGDERGDGSNCCLLLCEVNSQQHLMSEMLSRVLKGAGEVRARARTHTHVTDERVSVREKNRSVMI